MNSCQNETAELVRMKNGDDHNCLKILERVKGIEPSYSAWKAAALPLSYTREAAKYRRRGDELTRRAGSLNRPCTKWGAGNVLVSPLSSASSRRVRPLTCADSALMAPRAVDEHAADAHLTHSPSGWSLPPNNRETVRGGRACETKETAPKRDIGRSGAGTFDCNAARTACLVGS